MTEAGSNSRDVLPPVFFDVPLNNGFVLQIAPLSLVVSHDSVRVSQCALKGNSGMELSHHYFYYLHQQLSYDTVIVFLRRRLHKPLCNAQSFLSEHNLAANCRLLQGRV